ncbi:MAG: hypothetical protein UGF89_05880, partial [Acutalibacteraceae bacterium]|nr:hypothetical protein [Acutalibacteraceae bacterium]
IDNLSSYKKLIDDSLKEANSLIKQHKDDLKNCNQRIKEITKNLEELKEEYLQRMKNLRVPLQEIIEELKIKIKNISSQSIALKDLLSYMKELEKARAERQSINDDLKYLALEYEKASRKSGDDIKITDTWIKYYNDMYNSIFNVSDNKVKIERDYMPSINDTPIHKISSESVKLVAQLSYVYTLATLNSKLSGLSINHLGFMIFDSPKDKDLDMDKYKRFLSYLNKTENIQIFLTGSILDELSYKEAAPNANYLPTLYETNRLLKEPV